MKKMVWASVAGVLCMALLISSAEAKGKKPRKPRPAAPAARAAKPAWLGVMLSEVPKELDAHLGLKGTGAMVQNVAKGSPADKVGLKQYDVIVSVNGKRVDNVAKLTELIRARHAGDKAKLALLRLAAERTDTVTFAAAPAEPANVAYKYEMPEPAGPMISRMFVHPPMALQRGAKGWQWVPPGKGKMPPWIEEMRKRLPKMPQHPWAPGKTAPGIGVQTTVVTTKDGHAIEVTRNANGTITVKRSGKGKDGKRYQKEHTYKNQAELKKADPEASDLINKAHVHAAPGGIGVFRGAGHPGRGDVDKDVRVIIRKALTGQVPGLEGRVDWDEIQKQVDKALKDAGLGGMKIQVKPGGGPAAGRGGVRVFPKGKGEIKPRVHVEVHRGAKPPAKSKAAHPPVSGGLGQVLKDLPPAKRKAVVKEIHRLIDQAIEEALKKADRK